MAFVGRLLKGDPTPRGRTGATPAPRLTTWTWTRVGTASLATPWRLILRLRRHRWRWGRGFGNTHPPLGWPLKKPQKGLPKERALLSCSCSLSRLSACWRISSAKRRPPLKGIGARRDLRGIQFPKDEVSMAWRRMSPSADEAPVKHSVLCSTNAR